MNLAVAAVTTGLIVVLLIGITQQDFSWWVFPFIFLFGTIFTSVLWFCFSVYREDKFRKSALRDDPDRPWMWDVRWRSDTIPSRSKTEFSGNLAFSIILSMFALMSAAQMVDKLPDGNYWTVLGLIPIAAALYFVRNTYLSWIALCYERHISFVLETRPALVGSTFSGRLVLPQRFHLERSEIVLERSRVLRQQDQDGVSLNKVSDGLLTGQIEQREDEFGKHIVKVQVDIPAGSSETSWGHDNPRTWWDAVFTLRFGGREIQLRYEIPVFKPERK